MPPAQPAAKGAPVDVTNPGGRAGLKTEPTNQVMQFVAVAVAYHDGPYMNARLRVNVKTMKTIAIISQKGGAGKTTLALHLAVAAHAAGLASAILDTDPQATAAKWGAWREGADPDVIDCPLHTAVPRELTRLAGLGAQMILIDTPPAANQIARVAAGAADLLLIPCRPRAFDLSAVQTTAALARGKPAFVVFMAGPVRGARLYAEAGEVVAQLGLAVAPVMLPERATFHRSSASGQTAGEIEPAGKAAAEVAALWQWVYKQVN